jgi:hypothetical protein
VKPVPFTLVRHCSNVARKSGNLFEIAVADLITIAFFYLNRPGEYAQSTSASRSSPFRACDVLFQVGTRLLDTFLASFAELEAASFAMLVFTDQKNAVRGEKIGHGRTRDSYVGPVKALARRIQHLRSHHASPTTPLFMVNVQGHWLPVCSSDITHALRIAAAACFHLTGIPPEEISARSLRPGGATALLCAQVDSDIIQLVGRWRSDAMLRYLHAQAYPLMGTFAQRMVSGGSYSLPPGQYVPASATPLLDQVPIVVDEPSD